VAVDPEPVVDDDARNPGDRLRPVCDPEHLA
jgi:hypothetical protein